MSRISDADHAANVAALISRNGAQAPEANPWAKLEDLLRDPTLTNPPEALAPPLGYAGRLTLLAGREKQGGKSHTACAAIAAASQRGVRCLVVCLDEPLGDTVQRLARFGADARIVTLAWRRPDDLRLLIEETSGRVCVIDSLEKYAVGFVTESGNSFQWGAVLSPLQEIARELNVAVIIIHHANKADGGYRDSTAIGAAVDLIIELREQPDGTRRAKVRGRFAVPDFTVSLGADNLISFSERVKPETQGPAPRDLQRRVLRLLHNAEPEGLRSNEWRRLAIDDGLSRPTFYRARKALYNTGMASYTSRLYRVTRTGEGFLAEEA